MTILVLFILAVIWAAVLLPPYLQSRSESRPADSISSFQNQLSVLERRTTTVNPALRGRPSISPRQHLSYRVSSARLSRAAAKRRRAEVFFTLVAAAGLSFLLALIMGGPVWALNLVCDVLLAGYVMLLVQIQQRAQERAMKVRYLSAQRPRRPQRAPEPALLLRRSGS